MASYTETLPFPLSSLEASLAQPCSPCHTLRLAVLSLTSPYPPPLPFPLDDSPGPVYHGTNLHPRGRHRRIDHLGNRWTSLGSPETAAPPPPSPLATIATVTVAQTSIMPAKDLPSRIPRRTVPPPAPPLPPPPSSCPRASVPSRCPREGTVRRSELSTATVRSIRSSSGARRSIPAYPVCTAAAAAVTAKAVTRRAFTLSGARILDQ